MISRKWILAILCSLAVIYLQTFRIERPYLGHFASYQGTVMAEISRNMIREDFPGIFLPKTDVLIVEPWRTLHLNQYPFPSVLAAAGVKFFGGSLEFWGRFQAILFNFFSVVLLALIAATLWGSMAGWTAGILFLLAPFSLIYGQMFFSEPQALFFLLLAFWLLLRSKAHVTPRWKIVLSAFCFSVAVTSRVHYVLFLPAYVFFALQRTRRLVTAGAYVVTALILPAFWYGFTYLVLMVEPMRVHTTLFSQMTAFEGAGAGASLFALSYWKHVLLIFGGRMLTPMIFPFALWGAVMLFKARVYRILFFLIAAGGLIPVFLLPQKILDHEFYLYGFFPFVILAASFCISRILAVETRVVRPWSIAIFLFLFAAISLRLSIRPMFVVSSGEQRALVAVNAARELSEPSDIFIVGGEDTAPVSYYLDRRSYGLSFEKPRTLPSYYWNRSFTLGQRSVLSEMETAMQDDVAYLQYLKKMGASYVLLIGRSCFESRPELIGYLRSRAFDLSSPGDDFFLFRL